MTAFDTNILVYAFDADYPDKQETAKNLVEEVFNGERRGVITNQILGEFTYVTTQRFEEPLQQEELESIIWTFLYSENWQVLDYTGETVLHATRSTTAFWDGLLTQTLKEHGVNKILTENTQDFQGTGITPHNPFTKEDT